MQWAQIDTNEGRGDKKVGNREQWGDNFFFLFLVFHHHGYLRISYSSYDPIILRLAAFGGVMLRFISSCFTSTRKKGMSDFNELELAS